MDNKNSQSKIKASNRYVQKTYSRLAIRVKKGEETSLKSYADSQGMSLNNFVCSCLSYCLRNKIDVSTVPALTETLNS